MDTTTDTGPLRDITVIGNDATAWSVAIALAKNLRGHRVNILVIEAPRADGHGILPTVPAIHRFHHKIDINEADLVHQTAGAFTLGTQYRNWTGAGHDYVHGFGSTGSMIHAVEFHHFANRLRRHGDVVRFDDYSAAAHAVRLGRFHHPAIAAEASESVALPHALQLYEASYRRYLRTRALELGVRAVDGTVVGEAVHRATGFVERLQLDDGREFAADFVFDCRQDLSPLMRETLGVSFSDWSQWFPCDRLATTTMAEYGDTPLAVTLEWAPQGWCRRLSLPGIRRNELHYAAASTADEEAAMQVSAGGDAGRVEIGTQPLRGCLDEFWHGNCVALGNAAGYAGDLLVSGLHLAQSGVLRWLELYPDRQCDPLLAREYNRAAREEIERIRDVHLLHLRTASPASTFWRDTRSAALPETLVYKTSVFERTGILPFYESETLSHEAWISLLIGMQRWPERYDPLADDADIAAVRSELAAIAAAARTQAENMPEHDAVLTAIGGEAEGRQRAANHGA